MQEGFPLLTTKKIATKAMAVELEGFIKGITTKKWYQSRGCHIWDEWANPEVVIDNLTGKMCNSELLELQKRIDDLGPIYGYQWRGFNHVYDEDCNGNIELCDQLKTIVNTLKTNPDDRRMVCSAWNPQQIAKMALPPCHFAWTLTHIDGELNMSWTQRSCDLMLGVPFNIASYALLLTLLCKIGNFKPGNLTGLLCDCHIYENHLEGAQEQVKRSPTELPTISIDNTDEAFDIFNWTHENLEINNYNPQDRIKFPIAV
jgi:thymidylate synthase